MGMIVVETPGAAADTSPESMGLPPVKGTEHTPVDYRKCCGTRCSGWLGRSHSTRRFLRSQASSSMVRSTSSALPRQIATNRAAAASAGVGSLLFAICWPAKAPRLRMNERLAQLRHIVFDMDGTIYLGETLFQETIPFLARLRDLRHRLHVRHEQQFEEQGRVRPASARMRESSPRLIRW